MPHTSDSWTFCQELDPTSQTCCYGQILPRHSLRFIARGTLPIHRATPGAGFVQPRVGLRSRLDLKSRSRKRRPTRLQVMQIFYSCVLVVDLDHAASLRNGPLALGFEVPIFVSIPNGPETTDSCSQGRLWEGLHSSRAPVPPHS